MESNLEPVSAPTPQVQPQLPGKRLSGWGTLMAIIFIIHGVFLSMTIILAIFGVPLIIAGVKLMKAITVSKEITVTDDKTREMITNLNSFFQLNGFMVIGGIALCIIGLIAVMIFGFLAAISAGSL